MPHGGGGGGGGGADGGNAKAGGRTDGRTDGPAAADTQIGTEKERNLPVDFTPAISRFPPTPSAQKPEH